MSTETSKSLGRDLLLSALLCLCFLTFPLRVQADQAAPAFVNLLANPTPAECLFNWAENNYPALFAPAGSPTQIWTVYSYRYYPVTNAYLGVNSINNHVYYMGSDGGLQDEGLLADWSAKAGCQVPPASPAECLFNWAELNYPGLFAPAGSPWAVSSIDWTYRYYSLTNAFLGIQSIDNHVYYLGPDGGLQDEGQLADWTPKAACRPPVANAGPDQTAAIGATVTLDGSASTDLDGNLITYQWTLTQKPAGSQTALSNSTALHPTLAIDKPGTYVISLVVNDGQFDSAPATIAVNTQNSKPLANAGTAQSGKVGDTLALNGSASHDADGDVLTYHWTLPAKPQGSSAQLNNPDTVSPSLTLDKPGSYTAQLTVNDGKADSIPATVVLSTVNSKPVAKAGPAQSIMLTTPAPSVLLDGSGSSDADSDPLSFRWALISRPAGSLSTLVDPLAPLTRFTPDFVGDYVAQLIVNDGHADSDPNTAQIIVTAPAPPQNHPPQISTSPVLTATVGDSYSYDVDAVDSDNDTLTYSLIVLPSGMAIDAQTGLISWTPTAGQTDPQAVTVNVIDGKGGSNSQNFNVTVAAAGQIIVPDLHNLNRTAAETAIQQAQLNLGALTFQHVAQADGSVINQTPAAGTSVSKGTSVNLSVSLGPDLGLPPNPVTVAPRIDPTVATNTLAATEFLYKGDNPIQTGVQPGIIGPNRAAVLRGRMLDKQNNPLPGVTIAILNHPELGQTLSRADGQFDMAVNGGGSLTVNYQKSGYLPAQRTVNIAWQSYTLADNVVMIVRDAVVTTVNFGATGSMQVATGSVVNDASGVRRASVLIQPGTTAQAYNPDGTTRTVDTLSLRLTEYTVGPNGPASMPAALPPNSGYTYAYELSADEAVTKIGGKDVLFNQPVFFYVENFLNFPVGMAVPTGYYDSDRAVWIPVSNGRVIKVLNIGGGLADLDTDGDGLIDNGAAIGVTNAERQQLAAIYPAGQTLWRVGITHFSTWDSNWGIGPNCDLKKGQCNPDTPKPKPDPDDPCKATGSIIGCENQALGEALKITGTPISLHYQSDRVPGRRAAYTREIPLSGATIPSTLKGINLEITFQGNLFTKSFPPAPNQTYLFQWDGKDVYGRTINGRQPIKIRVGYVYDGVYQTPNQLEASFGYNGNGSPITDNSARQEFTIWQVSDDFIGGWDARVMGLGSWTLNPHHAYDPIGKVLYLGDGSKRSAFLSTINTLVLPSTPGEIEPRPRYLAVTPDGSIYYSSPAKQSIFRRLPDGTLMLIAGTGTLCQFITSTTACGDGGPATTAGLHNPNGVALAPDGGLYFADSSNNRIRRIDPNGIITTVAGGGTVDATTAAAIPATQAALDGPVQIAVGPDGSVYFSSAIGNRIFRVDPNGTLTTIAGGGPSTPNFGDDGPATQARIDVDGFAVSGDGSLYIAGGYFVSQTTQDVRVRKVDTRGIITTIAGRGLCFPTTDAVCGDGGDAAEAQFDIPIGLTTAQDGSLYITSMNRIRRIGPDGIVNTVAGTGAKDASNACLFHSLCGDGGPPTKAEIFITILGTVAVGPGGEVYIPQESRNSIRRFQPELPGFSADEIVLGGKGGDEVYVFDKSGRHLRTVDANTRAVRYLFGYDQNARLRTITDIDGNVTTIERDGSGNPTGILSHYGQRTVFSLDANGFLSRITNPAGESTQIAYTSDGLLTQFTDPKGNVSTMTYDSLGRLLRDTDAAGGFQELARAELDNGMEITRTTALGRITRYRVEDMSDGSRAYTTVFPDGTQTKQLQQKDGTLKTTQSDETLIEIQQGGDPRFGMQAPVSNTQTIKTPGGLIQTQSSSRSVTLTDPADPLSVASVSQSLTINGRTQSTVLDRTQKTRTLTSPAGRTIKQTLDDLGRPITLEVPGLFSRNFTYDTRGRLKTLSQGSGVDERLTTLNYDADGFLASAIDPLGRQESLEYDLAGRVTREILPDNRETLLSFDRNRNMASLTPPGRTAHAFSYTPVDLKSGYSPPSLTIGNNDTTYEYNDDRDLTLITRPDGVSTNYQYDTAGRLSQIALPEGDYVYTYHATTGRLTGVTAPSGIGLAHTFDGALRTKSTWAGPVSGEVSFTYDTDFRISSVSVNGKSGITYTYDPDSLLTKAGGLNLTRNVQNGLLTGTTLGQVNDTYTYNGFGELTTYSAKFNTNDLFKTEYSYDKLGRVTQKIETVNGVTTTFTYSYDLAGRLSEVKQNEVVSTAYTYDDNGNRLTAPNLSTNPVYDQQDRLIKYGDKTYTYTANGELASKNTGGFTITYQYDALGNLLKVTLPSGTQIDYVIDGHNRRIGKKVNGILVQGFLYQDQLRPIAELDGSGQVDSRFVYSNGVNDPDYMIKGGNTYRIIKDHLGSPRLVVDISTGAVAQRMDYDEFGRVVNDTNPGFQPFGFAGGLYDRDTRLLRFGQRDYDPEIGRWTAKDPILFEGGDRNLYAYVSNNPIDQFDPHGLQGEDRCSVYFGPNWVVSCIMCRALSAASLPEEWQKIGQSLGKLLSKAGKFGINVPKIPTLPVCAICLSGLPNLGKETYPCNPDRCDSEDESRPSSCDKGEICQEPPPDPNTCSSDNECSSRWRIPEKRPGQD